MLTIYEGYFGLSSMHLRVTKDVLVHVAQPMYRKNFSYSWIGYLMTRREKTLM
jgi:hypothetical protein